MTSDRTDRQLVTAARTGDIESFGELYRRHYAAMVGLAYSRLWDHHAAEDVAQEAFAAACRGLSRLRRPDRFVQWLAAICRRLANRARPIVATVQNVDAAAPLCTDDRGEAVRQAVAQLPDAAREVVVLHYFSGMSHKEIAAALRVSQASVHGKLIRARRKLAEILVADVAYRR